MATPPPTPPSPPRGDGTPDAGNPAGASPPAVEPKPGRQSARANAGGEKNPAPKRRTGKATTIKAAKPGSTRPAGAAAKPPPTARTPAKPRAAARPRPRTTKLSVATAPTRPTPVDTEATASSTPYRRSWWRVIAGGVGALAAGAALFSLRGSTRRKAHQADGSDSSKSFDAGIADEGAIPDDPATP